MEILNTLKDILQTLVVLAAIVLLWIAIPVLIITAVFALVGVIVYLGIREHNAEQRLDKIIESRRAHNK